MRCLVLAFSTMEDLPQGWEQFDHIDAYGQIKIPKKEWKSLPKNLTLHEGFFEISKDFKAPRPYDLCYIAHPDPYGEPRNWIKAVAAIIECVKGTIIATFFFTHEIHAFDLLISTVDPYIDFGEAKQLPPKGDWEQFEASWTIDTLEGDMYEEYQAKKHEWLIRFYQKVRPIMGKRYSLIQLNDLLQSEP